ncbi:MAG: DUF721 domain-containing protein [Candidatus Contendobacter sp.]|jgi:hypothetical protein|nr:DUF721 domain-containing protein [Gammaproteobacteria bacterium]MCC8993447.1 DUF721 domain-containing protein [Candidatus Contendobacter sp.]
MSGKQGSAGSDPRVVARQHITPLLKMLRGYGPADPAAATPAAANPVAAAESASPIVADAAGAYLRLLPAPRRQPGSQPGANPAHADLTQAAPAPPRRRTGNTPTVGEALLRQPSDALGRLMTQASQLAQSNRVFQAYLPPHLRDHTILLQMDQEAWSVQTESASWATRLRYALHDIRLTLGQQVGFPLPKPHIRVVPIARPAQSRRLRLTLTRQNAQLLEVAACTVPDVRLSSALRRLAQHAGPVGKPTGGA